MLRRPAGDGRRRSSETAEPCGVLGDERHDPVDQLGDRGELPTPEQPPGKDGEEQLRLVKPGGVTGRVVRVKPLVLVEPPAGRVGDVRRPVVEHQVHLEPGMALASNSSRKSMKLAAVLRSRSVAVKSPPPWTSSAASRFAVPWRTYSCSWRAGRPGAAGVVGRVRLRAPIPVFSSSDSTKHNPNIRPAATPLVTGPVVRLSGHHGRVRRDGYNVDRPRRAAADIRRFE